VRCAVDIRTGRTTVAAAKRARACWSRRPGAGFRAGPSAEWGDRGARSISAAGIGRYGPEAYHRRAAARLAPADGPRAARASTLGVGGLTGQESGRATCANWRGPFGMFGAGEHRRETIPARAGPGASEHADAGSRVRTSSCAFAPANPQTAGMFERSRVRFNASPARLFVKRGHAANSFNEAAAACGVATRAGLGGCATSTVGKRTRPRCRVRSSQAHPLVIRDTTTTYPSGGLTVPATEHHALRRTGGAGPRRCSAGEIPVGAVERRSCDAVASMAGVSARTLERIGDGAGSDFTFRTVWA